MKKLISIFLAAVCALSLCACAKKEAPVDSAQFPEFEAVDFAGNVVNNEIFKDYDATIVNFWVNTCGYCIEEMPELEAYYQGFKDKNINLIAIAISAGQSEDLKDEAETILQGMGVTFPNLIPDFESSFVNDFITNIPGYPTTIIVDSQGKMIGEPILGALKPQDKTLQLKLAAATN
ncbi:MAG: TlpA disulfide reductase family protein [Oscillospiraceae bacterium]